MKVIPGNDAIGKSVPAKVLGQLEEFLGQYESALGHVLHKDAEFSVVQVASRDTLRYGRIELVPRKEKHEAVSLWILLPGGVAYCVAHRPLNGKGLVEIHGAFRKAIIAKRQTKGAKGSRLTPAQRAARKSKRQLVFQQKLVLDAEKQSRKGATMAKSDVLSHEKLTQIGLVLLSRWSDDLNFNVGEAEAKLVKRLPEDFGFEKGMLEAALPALESAGIITIVHHEPLRLKVSSKFRTSVPDATAPPPNDDDQKDGDGGDSDGADVPDGTTKFQGFVGIGRDLEMQTLVAKILRGSFAGNPFNATQATGVLAEHCEKTPDHRGVGKVMAALIKSGKARRLEDRRFCMISEEEAAPDDGVDESVPEGATSSTAAVTEPGVISLPPGQEHPVEDALATFDIEVAKAREPLVQLRLALEKEIEALRVLLAKRDRELQMVKERLGITGFQPELPGIGPKG